MCHPCKNFQVKFKFWFPRWQARVFHVASVHLTPGSFIQAFFGWYSFDSFMNIATNCKYWKVLLSQWSSLQNCVCFWLMLPQGLKIAAIEYCFSASSLVYSDISHCPNLIMIIMYPGWSISQIISNFTLGNAIVSPHDSLGALFVTQSCNKVTICNKTQHNKNAN